MDWTDPTLLLFILMTGIALVTTLELVYARRGNFELRKAKNRTENELRESQHIQNTLTHRLTVVYRTASAALDTDPHPYQDTLERHTEALSEVCKLAKQGLVVSTHETFRFDSLKDALEFTKGITAEQHPAVTYYPGLDEDGYHVVYDLPVTKPEVLVKK